MNPIISFRRADTGAWGYRFYSDSSLLGTVSCVISHSSLVRIEAPGISWYSSFDIDNTIVPGISRHIRDNEGKDIYRIIYCEPGFYRIIPESSSSPLGGWSGTEGMGAGLLVEQRNGMYLFGEQGMPVVAMTERITSQSMVEQEKASILLPSDAEPFFRTTVFEERMESELLLMILAFPAVRMY